MEFKDYYAIMGVTRDASQDDIKRAYRKLARKTHPDVSDLPDAEGRFKELTEAYEVLRDPEKRVAYDHLGANRKSGESFEPAPDWDEGFEHYWQPDESGRTGAEHSEFFSELFGRGARDRGGVGAQSQGFNMRGHDSFAKLLIDIKDAYGGASRTIVIKHAEMGQDGRPDLAERTLNVQIPRGIRAGQHIRLVAQGGKAVGKGKPGDLYLEVGFHEHPLYRIDGADVYLELPVAPWEAALGASIQVPTPNGPIQLSIPPGSGSGRKLRLRGRGIPSASPGDFYAVLRLALPNAGSVEAKQAYRAFEEAFAFDPREHLQEAAT